MRHHLLFLTACLATASAACTTGDHELAVDASHENRDGGNVNVKDGGSHDGRKPEDAEVDRTSSHEEAGEDAERLTARRKTTPRQETPETAAVGPCRRPGAPMPRRYAATAAPA
jgi:hypothetical protein